MKTCTEFRPDDRLVSLAEIPRIHAKLLTPSAGSGLPNSVQVLLPATLADAEERIWNDMQRLVCG